MVESMKIDDVALEPAARKLAAWFGYDYDGLHEGRLSAKFKPRWAGRFQGRQLDVCDAVRMIAEALPPDPRIVELEVKLADALGQISEQQATLDRHSTEYEAIAKALGCGHYGVEYFLTAVGDLKAKNARLVRVLEECADDLAAELCARYPNGVCGSPSEERRFRRDMMPVRNARAALAETPESPHD